MLLGIELVENQSEKTPFKREMEITNTMISLAQDAGLLLYPSQAGIDGLVGDAFIIAPPLTITLLEIHDLIKRLQKAFSELEHYVKLRV